MLLLSTMYFVFCGGADFSQWSSFVSVGGPRLRLLRRTGWHEANSEVQSKA
ncbi:hypothetical protein PF010_g9188 [Phytophthora fragariae]|uniref:Uncharacterized protein n=1 Tax=Phytophthora fragariae TaxID=53985 RepID=A0A6A3L070_9STRA|nr:hypothetical protein PF003_g8660 [Phytophthora fragariae]KAE9013036.1 hypothetical protein PF011_g8662 [Phytophthora fragariae]KAE9115852.1 hypothetical protein PF010_g9188 [Phytophthora fragariae]KAE9236638.1 hypothetical protein PF004_g8794 [Phytophthora fragariae]